MNIKKIFLWVVLSIPFFMLMIGLNNGKVDYNEMMHTTGEFSARFLIFSLIATPLLIIFPNSKFPKWLVRNRRYFGVAAFIYALVHTVFYIRELGWINIKNEFFEFGILTGWIAFFIFIPLFITSNDYSVKILKKNWKKLQRWVYLAAICTFAHWAFIHYHWIPASIHFVPVLLLQIIRIFKK